jgi:hypothetical protein
MQIWLMNDAKEGHLSRHADAGKNSGRYEAGACHANGVARPQHRPCDWTHEAPITDDDVIGKFFFCVVGNSQVADGSI